MSALAAQHRRNDMLNDKSKVFFGFFFGSLLLSIGLTYYTIVAQGDFATFTNEEEVPEALDFYYDILAFIGIETP